MSAPSFRRRVRPPANIGVAVAPAAESNMADTPGGEDYRVGYKRPPIDTRFGGKRGNRSGRKKGSKTLEAALAKELKTKVEVNTGGRIRSLSKLEVLALNMVNSAIAGKSVSQRLVYAYLVQRAQLSAEREAEAGAAPDQMT